MSPNEYQKLALRTWNKGSQYPAIINGVLGLTGEAGECADMVKKAFFQGHDINREHFAKELGDVLWYIALCADSQGYTLEQVMQMNIDKLTARYPNGFDADHSLHRKSGDV